MSTLNVGYIVEDGAALNGAQLDAMFGAVETAVNNHALNRDNFRPEAGIGNDQKEYMYSYVTCCVGIPAINNSATNMCIWNWSYDRPSTSDGMRGTDRFRPKLVHIQCTSATASNADDVVLVLYAQEPGQDSKAQVSSLNVGSALNSATPDIPILYAEARIQVNTSATYENLFFTATLKVSHTA